jgi:hypothetical protein
MTLYRILTISPRSWCQVYYSVDYTVFVKKKGQWLHIRPLAKVA